MRERTHVLEVSRREAAHIGKRRLEVAREAVDNARAPALFLLAVKNVATDLPVKRNQFAIRAGDRALPGPLDALLEFGKLVSIVFSPHGSSWILGHSFGRWAWMIALGTEIIMGRPAVGKTGAVTPDRL